MVWVNRGNYEKDRAPSCRENSRGFPGPAGVLRDDFIDSDNRHVDARIDKYMTEEKDHVLGKQRIDREAGHIQIDQADREHSRADNDPDPIEHSDGGARHDRWRWYVRLGTTEEERPTQRLTEVAVTRNDRSTSLKIQAACGGTLD